MGSDIKGNFICALFKVIAAAGKGNGAGVIRNTEKTVLCLDKTYDILRIIHLLQGKGAFRIILKGHKKDNKKKNKGNQ